MLLRNLGAPVLVPLAMLLLLTVVLGRLVRRAQNDIDAVTATIKNLEAAETALLAEPDPTDLLCVGLEAVQAALKTLRGS